MFIAAIPKMTGLGDCRAGFAFVLDVNPRAEGARRNEHRGNDVPNPITLEQAQLGGRRSAEARARRRNLNAEVRALERFERASEQMAELLINAALGKAGFENLSSKDRAGFAVKCLEYGVRRPRQTTEPQTPVVEPVQQGLHFDVGPAPGASDFAVTGPQGDVRGVVDRGPDAGETIDRRGGRRPK
jgi:hypothetical protein